LIEENSFIILNRPGAEYIDKSLLPPQCRFLEKFSIDVSSTEVRERIRNSKNN
jgi:nicotinic acid mononucleotide adenylyltransferase